MSTERLSWKLVLILTLLALMGGTLSCEEEVETGPRAWIDYPRDKSSVPVGAPVSVISHAYARDGVAEVLLSVDGEAYRRDPPAQPGATFSEVTQEWLPPEAGVYTLQVVTYDTAGETSNPAMISIRVAGEVALVPTEEPPAEPTEEPPAEPTEEPTAEPTEEPTVEPTEEPPAEPTEEPTVEPTEEPTAEPTEEPAEEAPPPPAQVSFKADDTSLDQGECTTLRWDVEHATAVFLDGGGVPGHGTEKVCPESTTTYSLHVEAPSGNVDQSVTVEVKAPPPPAQVSFKADDTSLVQGECTTLRWDVENATAVLLDGGGVPGHGTEKVCPESTTTYNLHVEAPGGNVDQSVTIKVSTPPDTQGPDISGPKSSENTLANHCDCSPCKTDIVANVEDQSGVAWVKLIYRPPKGEERTGSMPNVGGSSYKATVTVDANGWKPGTLEFWVQAGDNKGNVSESGHSTISVQECVY
jgi:hypothetical protein